MQFSSFQSSITTRDGVYSLRKCTRFSVALVSSVAVQSQSVVPSVVVPSQSVVPSVAVPSQPVVPSVVVPSQSVVPSVAVPSQPVVPSVTVQPLLLPQLQAVVSSVVFLLRNPPHLYHARMEMEIYHSVTFSKRIIKVKQDTTRTIKHLNLKSNTEEKDQLQNQ